MATSRCSHISRSLSYYITTPIFYVNSAPHIGHVYSFLLADALNRFQRLKLGHDQTIFSTGLDEHGIKIQTAAASVNTDCRQFCDRNAQKFKDLFAKYDTTLTNFVRTSDDDHVEAVLSVWRTLMDKGYIHRKEYCGWYCTNDETFIPDSQVQEIEINGEQVHQDASQNTVHWSSEINYMFNFGHFKQDILDWLKRERPVTPVRFNDEAIAFLDRMGDDISISRPLERLNWGIRVPNDSSQTIYVWLDALINYLTVAGYPCALHNLKRWPIDCQILGKDILKFHALYWPAFLIALDLSLPRKLICHSHWLVDSKKISKSRGNVIDPLEENRHLTREGLRYFLLRNGTPHSDTNYDRTQAFNRVNSELANTYGCLMSRCCSDVINPNHEIPQHLSDRCAGDIIRLKERLKDCKVVCEQSFEDGNFYKGLEEIMSVLRDNHNLYEQAQPWKLVKELKSNPDNLMVHNDIQAITFEVLRVCSILLQPVIPGIAGAALDSLEAHDRFWTDADVKLEQSSRWKSSCPRKLASLRKPVFLRLKAQD